MGYVIFEKTYPSKSTEPTITISNLGRCTLNRAAGEMFHKDAVEHVLLLWDESVKKFAIRPVTKKDSRSFAVRYSYKDKTEKVITGAAFSGVLFLKHIGYDYSKTTIYPITRSEDGSLYEVELSKERFGGAQQLLAVDGGKRHGKAVGGH